MPHLTSLGPVEISGGRVSTADDTIHFELPAIRHGYADAQVDDYAGLRRADFPWRPPLRLSLSARASSAEPIGTLGFGFWNDPFSFALGGGGAARRLPATPQALWFFYGSPPNEMRFQADGPPDGWKASSLRSPLLPSWLLAPAALGAMALARFRVVRRPVMRTVLGVVTAGEARIDVPLDTWHRYSLDWAEGEARFFVEDDEILLTHVPPSGPLGFVAWIDNQYAVASLDGGLRFGVLPTVSPQWLEIRGLRIEASGAPRT